MKRILFYIVLIFITTLNINALEETANGDTFIFTDNGDGTCLITDYTDTDGNLSVDIPAQLGGLDVIETRDGGAFSELFGSTIESAVFPDTVETIGGYAFYNMFGPSALNNLTLGNSIKTIGSRVFSGSSLTEVDLPDSVETIEYAAFDYSLNLTTVNFGDSLVTMEAEVFSGSPITYVELPDSLSTIGTDVFSDCELEEVIISNNLTNLPSGAFAHNNNLEKITIGENVTIDDNTFLGVNGDFKSDYINNGQQSGLYIYNSSNTTWEYAPESTVTFVENGGSVVSDLVDVPFNTTISEPVISRVNHDLVGWFTEPEFSNEWDFVSDSVTTDITLYANWDLKTYNVRYIDWDGTELSSKVENAGTILSYEDLSPERSGYIFDGWSVEEGTSIDSDLDIIAQYDKKPEGSSRTFGDYEEDYTPDVDITLPEDNIKVEGDRVEADITIEKTNNENGIIEIIVEEDIAIVDLKIEEEALEEIAENNNLIKVGSGELVYEVPAKEISKEKILRELELDIEEVNDLGINVNIEVKENKDDIEYTIETEIGKDTYELKEFDDFVSRTQFKDNFITGGVRIYEKDRLVKFEDPVPTYIYKKDGKWFGKINSLTNSKYKLIYNPKDIGSVKNHWSKDIINDMASRNILGEREEQFLLPDKKITRERYLFYLVRALGIYRRDNIDESILAEFTDINNSADLIAISNALDYDLVKGYLDGTFKPNALITREEAMTMFVRAMKLKEIEDINTHRVEEFNDFENISEWARQYVEKAVGSGIFNGDQNNNLNPHENITYAETLTALHNFLVKTELINDIK